jgi:hypothetical protein
MVMAGRGAGGEDDVAPRVEQGGVERALVPGGLEPRRDLGQRHVLGAHLPGDERSDRRGLRPRRLLREHARARLHAIDDEEPEAERERTHDGGERQEHLHADAHARLAGAHEPRRHERDEQDQAHRRDGREQDPRHPSLPAAGRSAMR